MRLTSGLTLKSVPSGEQPLSRVYHYHSSVVALIGTEEL